MGRSLDHKILRGTEGESAVTRVIIDNGLSVNLLPRGGRSKHITEPCGRIGFFFRGTIKNLRPDWPLTFFNLT